MVHFISVNMMWLTVVIRHILLEAGVGQLLSLDFECSSCLVYETTSLFFLLLKGLFSNSFQRALEECCQPQE